MEILKYIKFIFLRKKRKKMKKQRSKIFKKKLKENYKKQSLAIFIIDEKPIFEDMKNSLLFVED